MTPASELYETMNATRIDLDRVNHHAQSNNTMQHLSILLSAACIPSFLALAIVFLGQLIRRKANSTLRLPSFKDACENWTPRCISNLYFAVNVVAVIQQGYDKCKNTAFRLKRSDTDLVVLPASVLEELSLIPSSIACSHTALERDLLGHFTGLELILESRIHHSILQRRLTPRLQYVIDGIQVEVTESLGDHFPRCEEWTRFKPYQVLAKVSAAISARTLVGPELCRDPLWLDISINYTENLFRTIVVLRLFPPWSHAVLARFLPSYWACQKYIKAAKNLLAPKFDELIKKHDADQWRPETNDKNLNVLAWLVEQARGNDRKAETLAQVEVILALASVHTILLRMVNVLYDLTAHPDLAEELKQEIEAAKSGPDGWSRMSYTELPKLDSTMRESQRLSPPTVLGMKRLFKEPYTFSNGIHISKGTYVCLPIYAIENDAENTPDPAKFDGLRSYRKRQTLMDQHDQTLQMQVRSRNPFASNAPYQFASIDEATLNFGYGKGACPGRYFASLVIKALFVKLLTEYDFRFLPGESRPANITAHEFLFCWPWHEMLVRRKQNEICPF